MATATTATVMTIRASRDETIKRVAHLSALDCLLTALEGGFDEGEPLFENGEILGGESIYDRPKSIVAELGDLFDSVWEGVDDADPEFRVAGVREDVLTAKLFARLATSEARDFFARGAAHFAALADRHLEEAHSA